MDKSTCTAPGCDKTGRAKGMCSTHYNRQNVREVRAECAGCGVTVVRSNQWARARYRVTCSTECRTYVQFGARSCPVPGNHASRSTPVPADHPCRAAASSPSPARRVPAFHAGYCAECGKGYIIASECVSASSYCSKTCAKRVGKRARRAREAGASGTFTWDGFTKLALSLGNVCAYCNGDGLLEPDHVVPISRGGHNGLANILPACRRCNGRKSDMTVKAWSARLVRDGHPPLDLSRFKHLTAHVWMADSDAA